MKENNLIKSADWYNPYYAMIGGVGYEISNIIIYNDNGEMLVETGRGWFDESNNYLGNCYIGEIVRKNKISFTQNINFIVKDNDTYKDKTYVLYIYYKNINYNFVGFELNNYWLEVNYTIFDNYKLNAIIGKRNIKSYAIKYSIDNYVKKLNSYTLDSHIDEFDNNLKMVKKIRNDYIKLKEIENNYSVDNEEDIKKCLYDNEKCISMYENNKRLVSE